MLVIFLGSGFIKISEAYIRVGETDNENISR